MHCAEVPVEIFERSDDGIMIEETGQPQETAVSCQSIEVVERFVDSSEFIPYHPLSGIVIQAGKSGICPFAHARSYFESLLIVCIQVLVEQSGQYLVYGVPWCPDAFPCDIALYKSLGKCTQIAVSPRFLHFRQTRHETVAFHFEYFFSGRCVHQCGCGEVMSRDVPSQVAVQGFPASEFLHGHISSLLA